MFFALEMHSHDTMWWKPIRDEILLKSLMSASERERVNIQGFKLTHLFLGCSQFKHVEEAKAWQVSSGELVTSHFRETKLVLLWNCTGYI